jgi:hypothetical protein
MLFWVVPVQIENDFRGDTLLFPSTMPEGTTAGNASVTALDDVTSNAALRHSGGASRLPPGRHARLCFALTVAPALSNGP